MEIWNENGKVEVYIEVKGGGGGGGGGKWKALLN